MTIERAAEESNHQPPRGRFRFGLKTLLAATLAVAAGLVALAEGRRWEEESAAILSEYNRVRGADGPTVASREYRGRLYLIANLRCRIDPTNPDQPTRESVTQEDLERRNSGMVWVAPPGEWVASPRQAIRLLADNL